MTEIGVRKLECGMRNFVIAEYLGTRNLKLVTRNP